ncbi:AraC-like DNA-binding protein [Kibdelosporangium banguiense]|uniref:AraC-like DNA-binding protein n=1 Tax=Kibdelosporangium banguiense TaxID=1365924 RepID=A0ABS4TRK4_9PSEU|nr:AraC family transcriptional regulator [Kibdelosporangium banguiense]MBP2326619.1 AraC-like DNA-binding protein [Kibdelosporangium banguiense]
MEWVRYRRLPDRPVETMHAHFEQHTYHVHSHESYSFGLTDFGAQAFGCRGESRTSSAGMIMAFNPDEPHDGRAAAEQGFTYRIVHIGPSLITDVLSDRAGRVTGMPLFADPVLHDPVLAQALGRLYNSLGDSATTLARDEALASAVSALVQRAAHSAPVAMEPSPGGSIVAARRVRELIQESYLDSFGADELAVATGCSRFALYRAFKAAYGMSPSDYQRMLRVREARRLIAAGHPVASAATLAGFADQAHLTRWFRRTYGITPGTFSTAGR